AHDVELARYLDDRVRRHPDLESMCPVTLSIACFRYAPDGVDDATLDALNERLMIEIRRDGRTFPSNAVLGGRYCLRACFVNHRTEADVVDHLVDAAVSLEAGLSRHCTDATRSPTATSPSVSTSARRPPRCTSPLRTPSCVTDCRCAHGSHSSTPRQRTAPTVNSRPTGMLRSIPRVSTWRRESAAESRIPVSDSSPSSASAAMSVSASPGPAPSGA